MSRRGLLAGGVLAAGGALAGGAAVTAARSDNPGARPVDALPVAQVGTAVEAFHGPRQAGVATDPQAHAAFVAFTLKPGTDRVALGRMLRLLSDDAARLTQGDTRPWPTPNPNSDYCRPG